MPMVIPTGAPSLVTPPPSGTGQRPDQRELSFSNFSREKSTKEFRRVNKNDMKYVLDPLCRERTNLGTYVEGKSLVKPYKPRGPDPLPPRPPKQNPPVLHVFFDEDLFEEVEPPEFTLEDLMLDISTAGNIPIRRVQETMLSRHNYKKLHKLLAQQFVSPDPTLSVLDMDPSGMLLN